MYRAINLGLKLTSNSTPQFSKLLKLCKSYAINVTFSAFDKADFDSELPNSEIFSFSAWSDGQTIFVNRDYINRKDDVSLDVAHVLAHIFQWSIRDPKLLRQDFLYYTKNSWPQGRKNLTKLTISQIQNLYRYEYEANLLMATILQHVEFINDASSLKSAMLTAKQDLWLLADSGGISFIKSLDKKIKMLNDVTLNSLPKLPDKKDIILRKRDKLCTPYFKKKYREPDNAGNFETWIEPFNSRIETTKNLILENINIKTTNTILDLGCGDGRLLESVFSDSNFKKTLVDSDSTLLNKAKQRTPNSHFFKRDILEYLGSCRSKFDVIILSHVLYYFPIATWRKIINLAQSKLTQNGKLVVIMVSKDSTPYLNPFNSIVSLSDIINRNNEDPADIYLSFIEDLLNIYKSENPLNINWYINLPVEMRTKNTIIELFSFLYRIKALDLSDHQSTRICDEVKHRDYKLNMIDKVMIFNSYEP